MPLPAFLRYWNATIPQGPGDYLLKVLFRDMQDMENFLSRTLKDIRGVADTNTIICLSTLKEEITV